MRRARKIVSVTVIGLIGLWIAPAIAVAADLSFHAVGDGVFSFDTGVVNGTFQANDAGQGLTRLIHTKTGVEFVGEGWPGLLGFYRLLAVNRRWGDRGSTWPKRATVLPNGGLQIVWPAHDEHPFELTAMFRWVAPDTLDLVAGVRPREKLERFELFLASYFRAASKGYVYVKKGLHWRKPPASFVPMEMNPLVAGTFLAFPRDLDAVRLFYDGRWQQEPHPVQFSMLRFLAAPLTLRHNAEHDVTFAMMARPEDCFAIETSYDKEPAGDDMIARHRSIYLSLFGQDVAAGQRAQAHCRFVIGQHLSHERAIGLYETFVGSARLKPQAK